MQVALIVRSPNQVFGLPLETLMQQQQFEFPTLQVPYVARLCVEVLAQRAAEAHSITGDLSPQHMDVVRHTCQSDWHCSWISKGPAEAHIVSAVYRRFFQELPGGIFGAETLQKLLEMSHELEQGGGASIGGIAISGSQGTASVCKSLIGSDVC